MCGIAGIVSLGRPVDLGALQRMTDLQAHRGPDGEGFVACWENAERFHHAFLRHTAQSDGRAPLAVGLGHRRLAIVDLTERGRQPMTVADGQSWIVFNGEIYNHLELRAQLETLGYCFTTRTDTEVLLQAYRHWGEDCLGHLQGMFAFAIWDGARGRLFCARDRLGIKPFYYATPSGSFVFASEMKALLAFPGLDATPDDDAVLDFLVHGNCDYGERTLVRAVKALPAGHSLGVDTATGRLAARAYWQLTPSSSNGVRDLQRIDDLRAPLSLTQAGVVRLVDRLVAAGLVRRVAAVEGDRRTVALALTRVGAARARALMRARERAIGALLAGLAPAQVAGLAAVSDQVLATIASDDPAPGRLCRYCDEGACDLSRCPVELAAVGQRGAA